MFTKSTFLISIGIPFVIAKKVIEEQTEKNGDIMTEYDDDEYKIDFISDLTISYFVWGNCLRIAFSLICATILWVIWDIGKFLNAKYSTYLLNKYLSLFYFPKEVLPHKFVKYYFQKCNKIRGINYFF